MNILITTYFASFPMVSLKATFGFPQSQDSYTLYAFAENGRMNVQIVNNRTKYTTLQTKQDSVGVW